MKKRLLLIFVLLATLNCVFAQRSITGKVQGDDGVFLPGVAVMVKGTSVGTVTDIDGVYSLQLPEKAEALVFSFIGMVNQEIEIKNRPKIDVTMLQDVVGLEEVVAIGYGTMKKKDLTGAVTQIDAEKLATEATANMTDLLRANVPGLNVGFSTSAKGISSASSMEVRGETNLRGSSANAPLIVVDGMIFNGDLSDINPSDIEAFDILKDASSAAIYGSRASNGVILITTKRGRKGKPSINVSASVGLAKSSGQEHELLDGQKFIDWRIAGFESNERHQLNKPGYYDNVDNLPSGVSVDDWKAYDGSSASNDLNEVWLHRLGFSPIEVENYNNQKSINWYDEILQTGLRQDYNVSLSGSTDALKYYWSLGYVDNEGVVKNEKYEGYRSRINLEGEVAEFLTVGLNTQFAFRDESNIASSTNVSYLTPYSSYYEKGSDEIAYAPSGNISMSRHPHQAMTYIDRLRNNTSLSSKIFAKVGLPAGFTFTSEFITRFNFYKDFNSYSSEYLDYEKKGGLAQRTRSDVYEWQVNNILNWNHDFGAHSFGFTFVQNAEKYQSWYETTKRSGFQPSDILGYHSMQSATTDETIESNDEYSTADALLARVNYTYDDRYLLTASWRRDGYSAFGQEHPRAAFGSFALGWTISNEEFFSIDWMDLLKLRASYGTNGNRAVGRYQAMSDLSTGKYVLQTDGTAEYVSQLYVNRMANPNLQWEKTAATNFGIDFSTFEGRLRGNIEVYNMKTTDLLVSRKLPDITGYSSVFSNLGEVNNKGFEIGINTINIDKSNFVWNSNITLSHNRNKIVSLYGDLDENGKELDDETNKWFIGHALDQVWDYKLDGIWQQDEEEEAAKYSREPGDYKIVDQLTEDTDGDGVADAVDGVYTNDDKVFQEYKKPKYRLTFRNDFTWKNWTASVKMYSYLDYFSANNHLKNADVFYDRGSAFDVPYWTPENPSNKWARVESYSSGFNVYENNSFIRIDNVAVTYNVPSNVLNQIKMQRCSISLIAQNPYVWSKEWSWMDPEKKSINTPSYYTVKLNLTL